MKRQEHTVNRTDMSRLTYCLQSTAKNPPTPQQHCQVEVCLSLWRRSQNNSKNIFFMFCRHRASAPITSFSPFFISPKQFWQKNPSVRFWPFFAMTVTWPPHPQDPLGWFFRQLAHVILGGSPFKLTWQVDLTSCHLSSDLNRCPEWQVNLTSATFQVSCQVPLVPKCKTLPVARMEKSHCGRTRV